LRHHTPYNFTKRKKALVASMEMKMIPFQALNLPATLEEGAAVPVTVAPDNFVVDPVAPVGSTNKVVVTLASIDSALVVESMGITVEDAASGLSVLNPWQNNYENIPAGSDVVIIVPVGPLVNVDIPEEAPGEPVTEIQSPSQNGFLTSLTVKMPSLGSLLPLSTK